MVTILAYSPFVVPVECFQLLVISRSISTSRLLTPPVNAETIYSQSVNIIGSDICPQHRLLSSAFQLITSCSEAYTYAKFVTSTILMQGHTDKWGTQNDRYETTSYSEWWNYCYAVLNLLQVMSYCSIGPSTTYYSMSSVSGFEDVILGTLSSNTTAPGFRGNTSLSAISLLARLCATTTESTLVFDIESSFGTIDYTSLFCLGLYFIVSRTISNHYRPSLLHNTVCDSHPDFEHGTY